MPQMSGYEVCKRIREKYSIYELPVLMLTAQNNPEAIFTGFESGANDFLPKPFEMDELKARAKPLLQLKKSVQHGIHAEMAFLQAQIKPHFLYNALNTIISFCYTDPEKAADLITELSNYLRSSFDFSNLDKFVRIEKEMEFIQSYLAIEKARFEERINCEYDVDPINFMIPTLLLQPIVENAVKHGILKKEEGGNIKISIKEKGDFIIIKVEDDGIGISKEKLKTILRENFKGKSVGLRNVTKRFKRIYGYGIEIESEIGKGTIVSIKIPIKRGEGFD
jgi:sensor histidine kinase YesM